MSGARRKKKRGKGKTKMWTAFFVFMTAFVSFLASALTRKEVIKAVEDDENVKLLLVKSAETKRIENMNQD